MSVIWTDIDTNFKTLIEGTIDGIASNRFHEVTQFEDISFQPNSVYDHSYHVHSGGIDKIDTYTQNRVYFSYIVNVQMGFYLGPHSSKTDYDAALVEVEHFIRARLSAPSWASTIISNIRFRSMKAPDVQPGTTGETFLLCEPSFAVEGVQILSQGI